MADNTTLNAGVGGDVIATEDIAAGDARGDANLPLTEYKAPRSKIAMGIVDQDLGDVSDAQPFPVRDRTLELAVDRLSHEIRELRQILTENLKR